MNTQNIDVQKKESEVQDESKPEMEHKTNLEKQEVMERMTKMMTNQDIGLNLEESLEDENELEIIHQEEPVIELEEDDSVQSRFAALRKEFSDGDGEDNGSVEDRMKKFFGE